MPNKPDGSKIVYRAAVKTGVIFKDAKNKAAAKKFVAFMLDEANLTPYVEGSLGRWFPVTKNAQQSAFWKTDPHRLAVYNQFMSGTVPFEFTKNYKFTVLNNENVWAKAMNRILNEKVPVDKAIDEMIARIKTVAGSPDVAASSRARGGAASEPPAGRATAASATASAMPQTP